MKKKRKTNRKPTRGQAKRPPAPNGSQKVTPSILAWARKHTNEKEIAAGLREIRKTGGLALKDFWTELQEAAKPR